MNNDWQIIDVYSRAMAIADGVQVEANPETRKEAGFKYPVFMTTTVYNRYVKVPPNEDWQDEDGRLWDIFTMLKYYARKTGDGSFIEFKVSVYFGEGITWQPNEKRDGNAVQRLVTLHAVVGPTDFDDPAPAITIMLPGED
jgi:hypothetical protein